MRILLISDIAWYQNILESFKNMILRIKPSLVLFGGDIVGSGDSLLNILRVLDEKRIHSFIVIRE
ncbi:MAG: metallophosphoesterase [Candidatus Wukongarchaeota archaeon]|nr:hypothetical protein [Candidatus Wukongarchaeota archaeon]